VKQARQYDIYSKCNIGELLAKEAKINKFIIYKRYLHLQATSEHSHHRYRGTCIREWVFIFMCERSWPPLNAATFWHLSTHFCWSDVTTTNSSGKWVGGSCCGRNQGCNGWSNNVVKILQQCLSASSCMQTCVDMEEHHTGCQHSNGLSQFY
jgi:hypothetical protein